MRFLPPETLAKLGRCELSARGVVEGFISGRHKSPFKGFSVEFAEHRQYTPGDDLRNLDWRVLARKDRYFIKQYIDETNMRVTLLLDASGSMAYAGDEAAPRDGRPLSKLAYAQYIAAMLGYLLVNQQDAAGLVTFDTALRTYLPARARASQVRSILETLDQTEPGGETALAKIFHDIAERIPRRGMVVILSDLYDDPAALIQALHHFRYRRHEVLLFHIVAEEELTFPFESYTKFQDLECADNRLPIDPRTIRATYLTRMRAFLDEIEAACGRLKIDYVRMNTRVPYDQALAEYLSLRN
ncbi:MAG: DUF58 domain-containing protein [Kiritimatiellae bacterium]|jgi:uncharacterized protein (DUF58 family)|nr:DUF58 domain-containing protein [Kiritimatiellia bacterium]MDD2347644.1 DUF58 domain-containing protein [Kiritimatiellia bacterium]MDD3582658.1 DUF58 domain-containing protein [Kiritimatiellia bacterium]HHU13644.1 DUF58 domain-containing protein [Lentisphaerota bacterium]HON46661.1 DUF58 domain-containing protein [Kiritimatiellia bacterium]